MVVAGFSLPAPSLWQAKARHHREIAFCMDVSRAAS